MKSRQQRFRFLCKLFSYYISLMLWATLAFLFATTLHAQVGTEGAWTTSSVVRQLPSPDALLHPVTAESNPSLVISSNHRYSVMLYIPELSSFHYSRAVSNFSRIFSVFGQLVPSFPNGRRPDAGLNLLAIDSSSTSHFVGSGGTNGECLQHALNIPQDLPHSSYSTLQPLDDQSCSGRPMQGAMGVDRYGALHLVTERNGTIIYRSRSVDGLWSDAVIVSGDTGYALAPQIGVSPEGIAHIAYLMRGTESGTEESLCYVVGSGMAFEAPRILTTRSGSGVGDPFSLTISRHSMIEGKSTRPEPVILVVERDGTGIDELLLFRRSDPSITGQEWNGAIDPEQPIAAAGKELNGTIERCELLSDRYGALQMMLAVHPTDNPGDSIEQLYYLNDADSIWSDPVSMTSWPLFPIRNRRGGKSFDLNDSLIAAVVITRNSDGITGAVQLVSNRLDFRPKLRIPYDTIDLGRRPSGLCDTSLLVANDGYRRYESLTVQRIVVDPGAKNVEDINLSQTGWTIAGRDSATIGIGLTLTTPGPFVLSGRIESNGGNRPVVIIGEVMPPELPNYHIWLDTNTIGVGNRSLLRCHIAPPLDRSSAQSELQLRLRFDPDHLFPVATLPAVSGTEIFQSSDRPGELTILIRSINGEPIIGASLFSFECQALLTAEPHSPVAVEPLTRFGAGVSASSGLFQVIGCEIGRDLNFGRGGFASRPSPNPAGDQITLRTIAPSGTAVEVRIYDLDGVLQLQQDLGLGDGTIREEVLKLSHLPVGTYLLELKTGERRSVEMIVRE